MDRVFPFLDAGKEEGSGEKNVITWTPFRHLCPGAKLCVQGVFMTNEFMQTRRLGNSDLMITPTGCGSWAVGGAGWAFGWGHQDDSDSIAAILRALELGVNWIDTAAVYGLGHGEEIVARALEEWKGKTPLVFTKCGLIWDAQGQITRKMTASLIRKECEDSLRRLRTDVIDLYQVHWPPHIVTEIEEGWATLAALRKEGKVRWIGVSNFNAAQMERCRAIADLTSLQPPYSLIRREIEPEILPYCRQHSIGVITYAPMASGLLTGAMTAERAANLPDDDWRKRDPEFNEPNLSRNLALVERLKRVAARFGRTPGEVAIAWVLSNPAVTGAIVGTRSAKQAEGVMRAAEVRLRPEDIAEIEGATEQ
jgi:aryl-alcohol dehydrogenase-like predicted oxidoreductase